MKTTRNKMFDEYLCKHIQKKEITLYDVLCYYSVDISIALFIVISSSIVIYCDSVNRNVSLYTALIDYSIVFVEAIVILAILLFSIYGIIRSLRSITKIKIAVCPNFKPTENEE